MHDLKGRRELVGWGRRRSEQERGRARVREMRTRKPRRPTKEREPPRQMGSIAMSNGPYLDPISTNITRGQFESWYGWDGKADLRRWGMAQLASCILNH